MSYTFYSIIPPDGTVVIDGVGAQGVDMTGIPSDVNAIQWNGVAGTGTIEYKYDFATNTLPPPGSFTNPDTYVTQVVEALSIIDAYLNPVTYYFTEYTEYEGGFYRIGAAYTSYAVGHPQPPNTTTQVAPIPDIGQELWWYGGVWVVSSFDPSLTLPEAKTSLIKQLAEVAARAVDSQLTIYSVVQLIQAASVGALVTRSYPGVTLNDYQVYVDGVVTTENNVINAAGATLDLYSFNPENITFDNPPVP